MGIVQVLIIILFVVAAIVATIKQGRAARQRSLDLQTLAARLGFDDFNSNRDEGFAMGWGFLSRLAQDNDRYAFNISSWHVSRTVVVCFRLPLPDRLREK